MNTEMYEHITELQDRCDTLIEALQGAIQAIEAMPPDYMTGPYVHSRLFEAKKVLQLTHTHQPGG